MNQKNVYVKSDIYDHLKTLPRKLDSLKESEMDIAKFCYGPRGMFSKINGSTIEITPMGREYMEESVK